MFKRISKILMIMVCCATVLCMFTGCSGKLKGGPSTNDFVYGNGGLAVVKGEYVYYVNAYTSHSTITSAKQNKQGSVKKSGIYRTKLENGKLVYTYNEKDTEQEYSYTLTKTEQVVSKVAGHEDTKLYIFDDYIYYSSPNTDKDSTGAVKNEYFDFYMCNLDSTGNKHLYKSQASSSNQDYAFIKIGNTVYLVCYDGTNLVIVNTKTKSKETISNSVTSVAFKEQTNYFADSHSVTDVESYVYYTRANSDENAEGNVLAKAKIATGEETIIDQNNSCTYEVFGVEGTELIYGKKNTSTNSDTQAIYKYNANQEIRLYSNLFQEVFVVPYNGTAFNGVIAQGDNGVFLITGENQVTTIISETATVLDVTSNYVYTLESDKIYKTNLSNPQNRVLVSGEATVDKTMTRYMSVASSYAFFYTSYKGEEGTSYYLNLSDTTMHEDNTCTPNFIGLFIGKDKPVETYNEEE